jgi:hypothetical protein
MSKTTQKQTDKAWLAAGLAVGAAGTTYAVHRYRDQKRREEKRKTKHLRKRFRQFLKQSFDGVVTVRFADWHHASVYGPIHMKATVNRTETCYFVVRDYETQDFFMRYNPQDFHLKQIRPVDTHGTITDSDLNYLSDCAYDIEHSRADHDDIEVVQVGDRYLGLTPDFEVVAIADNQDNGFQAMALKAANRIVIAFAGTNPTDAIDWTADLESIVREGKPLPTLIRTIKTTETQPESAMAFFERVKADYPDATVVLTGHSLGGFLGLYVGAETQTEARVFNGPDPYAVLSDDAKTWTAQTHLLQNYRNTRDGMGNFGGNGTGAARDYQSKLYPNPFNYHGLQIWQFDTEGRIIIE